MVIFVTEVLDTVHRLTLQTSQRFESSNYLRHVISSKGLPTELELTY